MKPLLATLLEEFRDVLTQEIIHRDQRLPEVSKKILAVIGMRRVGKTYFLYQQVKDLLQAKIPFSRILYLNFEDDRLLPMDGKTLSQLMEAFYSLFPENHDHLCYLFLDEIQNVEAWPNVIRRFLDTKKVKIFLTGSSAKLLSKEISSSLRGRSLATEIWPYSFAEYLSTDQAKLPQEKIGKATQDKLLRSLENYIHIGGFPEVQTVDPKSHIRILQDYVDVVIFRDIVERYKITNISLIRYLVKTVINNIAAPFSLNKLFNDLKSQGIRVSKNTIYEYLSHIEDAYLAFMVPLFSPSLRKRQTNPRKVYCVDPGLARSQSPIALEKQGAFFENLVYLDLRRKGYAVSYYLTAERHEVDFVAQDLTGKIKLFQVSWDIRHQGTKDREERALQQAEQELGITGMLVTANSYFDFLKII